MRHVLAIARRELESYVASPIACAVLTIFTFVSGFFFSSMLVYAIRQAALADQQIDRLGRSDFQLDVEYGVDEVEVNDLIDVRARIKFTPPEPVEAGMVVLDVAVPTGFAPETDLRGGSAWRRPTPRPSRAKT